MMRKALLVGIDTSGDNMCQNDIGLLAPFFKKHGDGSPNFGVIESSTRSSVRDLLKILWEENQNHCDAALLFFSGHGVQANGGGLFLGTEGVLPMAELLSMVNNSNVRHKIVILNCCYAGNMGSPGADTFAQLAEGVCILTASGPCDKAYATSKHSLFTQVLCMGLGGAAADITGLISPSSLYAHAESLLGSWSQRPQCKLNISMQAMLRRVQPRLDLNIIRQLPALFTKGRELPLDPAYEESSPEAEPDKTARFAMLRHLSKGLLVEPVGESSMYWAAMRKKSCRLTDLGHYYAERVRKNLL